MSDEENKLTRQKIVLTPYDSALVGKIQPSAEHVHVLLDSTIAPFTVPLPDATASMKRELIFKNIGVNDVTLLPISGQYLDLDISHVVEPLDLVGLWSDLVKTWWLQDSNKIGTLSTNWRCVEESGTGDLVFQKKVGGVWTEKSRIF
jgi:hypothetical protein